MRFVDFIDLRGKSCNSLSLSPARGNDGPAGGGGRQGAFKVTACARLGEGTPVDRQPWEDA